MTAVIYAFPDDKDPCGSLERIQHQTGRVAVPVGGVKVELRLPNHITSVVPMREWIPAFLRMKAAPLGYSFDADGPKGAA